MLLESLLLPGALTVLFQPILLLRSNGESEVYGYEALIRGPAGTHATRADMLFEYVRRKRAEPVVDAACLVAALKEAQRLPQCPRLALNVHASTLGSGSRITELLVAATSEAGLATHQLVIEVVEHSSYWNSTAFRHSLASLRSLGMRVAIDDLGVGQSNLDLVLEVRPDLLKLDRRFVTGAARDPGRQAVLRAVQLLANDLGAAVVAEGVECEEDLGGVRAAGIGLAQGFFFSRPLAASAFVESPVARSFSPTM